MEIGLLINGGLTYYCGSTAVKCFREQRDVGGWLCLFCSSWNLALVMKFISDVL